MVVASERGGHIGPPLQKCQINLERNFWDILLGGVKNLAAAHSWWIWLIKF